MISTKNERHCASTLGELTFDTNNDSLDSVTQVPLIVGEALRSRRESNNQTNNLAGN